MIAWIDVVSHHLQSLLGAIEFDCMGAFVFRETLVYKQGVRLTCFFEKM